MSVRTSALCAAERTLLVELRAVGDWVSAIGLAHRVGWPWRIVARALGRMSRNGAIETRVREWRSAKSRIRVTVEYRARRKLAASSMPAWLSPPVPKKPNRAAVRVVRFGVLFVDDEGHG